MTRGQFLAGLAQGVLDSRLDIHWIPPDLHVPELSEGPPQAGARVRVGSAVYHVLCLPEDWQAGQRYPVIVEYAGNGPYKNDYGDVSAGVPEGSSLGYGISGGRGFLWLCLPFIDSRQNRISTNWWGDAEATVDYCLETVPRICRDFGGDPNRVLLCGFSRGSIACNYVGLRNDRIAKLWRAFVCYSHYDGVRRWPYADWGGDFALERLRRLKGRPQFICQEDSVEETRKYISSTGIRGDFTFQTLPYRNHNDTWVLRPIPLRAKLRAWVHRVLA